MTCTIYILAPCACSSSSFVLGKFQSTLPRGSDLSSFTMPLSASFYFNPRSLAGATPPLCSAGLATSNFNPRSLAGATVYAFESVVWNTDFNPRSLAGATSTRLIISLALIFQSTLPRGSDLDPVKEITAAAIFQSTLPRGSDSVIAG